MIKEASEKTFISFQDLQFDSITGLWTLSYVTKELITQYL